MVPCCEELRIASSYLQRLSVHTPQRSSLEITTKYAESEEPSKTNDASEAGRAIQYLPLHQWNDEIGSGRAQDGVLLTSLLGLDWRGRGELFEEVYSGCPRCFSCSLSPSYTNTFLEALRLSPAILSSITQHNINAGLYCKPSCCPRTLNAFVTGIVEDTTFEGHI